MHRFGGLTARDPNGLGKDCDGKRWIGAEGGYGQTWRGTLEPFHTALAASLPFLAGIIGWMAANLIWAPWIKFRECRADIRETEFYYNDVYRNFPFQPGQDIRDTSDEFRKRYYEGHAKFRLLASRLEAVHEAGSYPWHRRLARIVGYDIKQAITFLIGLSNAYGDQWVEFKVQLDKHLKFPESAFDKLFVGSNALGSGTGRHP